MQGCTLQPTTPLSPPRVHGVGFAVKGAHRRKIPSPRAARQEHAAEGGSGSSSSGAAAAGEPHHLALPWPLSKLPFAGDADSEPAPVAPSKVQEEPASGPEQEGEEAAEMPHEVDEVFENQRFFGIAWKAPLSVLDWPGWSDAHGRPVVLARRPSEDLAAWQPVATTGTDEEGWQYATVFNHLENKRPGGRSSQRFGDTVRRRLWRRRPSPSGAAAPAVAVPAVGTRADDNAAARGAAAAAAVAMEVDSGSASGMAAATGEVAALAGAAAEAAAVRAAREAEAKKRAVKAFMSLVLDLLSRRQLWTLVPWDPAALFVLYKKHQQVYQQLQAQAYERRLFTSDQPAPPSQLRQGRTMLQDLLCAAMHSRAAYGYAMQAGHVSSVAAYIKLQTLQPLTFDAVAGVSVEANNESVAALAGIQPEDILMAEWRNSPYRPCHYVAIDRANQCIVLSIRGSLQLGDLLSDLSAHPMEVDIGGADGWVHQGIFVAATYIHCNTQEALQEAARRCPGWPLLLTGHSLGGGVAALLTLLLQQSGLPEGLGPMRSITMGTAAVMSQPLAEACNELVTSVIVGSDVVPHLSYASVEALLVEASAESPVRRTVEGLGSKLAGALGMTAAEKRDMAAAAAAAGSGSWGTVKEASARLGRSASNRGLAKVASMVKEQANGMLRRQPQEAGQRQQQGAAAPAARQIPVIDLSNVPPEQQAAAAAAVQQQQRRQQQVAAAQPQPGQQQQAGAAALQPISGFVPAADAAGLEGFFAEPSPAATAAQSAAAAAAPAGPEPWQQQQQPTQAQHAAAAPQQQQEEEQAAAVLPYITEFDSPLLDTAVAQEAAAGRLAAEAAGGADSGSYGDGDGGGPGNPELLFPPGRIIWIFPEDEDVDTSMMPAEAEQQLQAMDAAWQGVAGEEEEEEGVGEEAEAAGWRPHDQQQQLQQQQAVAAGRAAGSSESAPAGGSSGGRQQHELTNADAEVQGHGCVSIEEAMEAVEAEGAAEYTAAGDAAAAAAGGESGQEQQQQPQQPKPPVAVDADRASFERLLLMPDMLKDHLPDRYLAALQQL